MPAQRPGRPCRQTARPRLHQGRPDLHAGVERGGPRARRAALILIIAASLIAGCAIDPVKNAEGLLERLPPNALAEARRLERDGQPSAAAEAYLALAANAAAPTRQQLEIEAAEALLQAGQARRAHRLLLALEHSALTASQRPLALLLQADVALSRGRAQEAISSLDRVNQGRLPAPLKRHYLGALAAAYRLGNQPVRAAETLDQLDRLLNAAEARMDNQIALLFTLTSLNQASLARAADASSGRVRGWLELAQLLAGKSTPSPALDARLREWRQRTSNHPALPKLETTYFARLAGGYAADTKVRVLLPMGGPFSTAGSVLKEGIMAAYAADRSGTRPVLSFGADNVAVASRDSLAGAELVIGPLQKSSVAALARQSALPVPTLALNRVKGATTWNLFQFSLAPEDEAANAAHFAFAAGLKRAVLVYPQSAWGTRMAEAFRTQWRALGGTFVTQPSYGAISEAAAAVARSEAQVVLLVATTQNVVPLWEALRLTGVEVPVIATSHVYDGTFDAAQNQALAGLYFVDIPWLLDQQRSDRLSRQALQGTLSNISGPLARLYPMGIDAYRLAPRIAEMSQQPGTFFPGETGGLSLDSRGQVRRQLTLARFTPAGVVTPAAIHDAAAQVSPD